MKKLFHSAMLGASILMPSMFYGCGGRENSSVANIKDEQMKNSVILDVRTTDEFNAGHLDGALHIILDNVKMQVSTVIPDKKKTVFVYCRSGRRSGIAKEIMDSLGYENVINVGGLNDAAVALNKAVVK